MAWEPPRLVLNPYQDQTTQDIVNTVQTPQRTRKPTLSPELQISSAQFNLPEGWIVEERPRRSNPTHVDRVYLSSSSFIYHRLFMHACALYHSHLLTGLLLSFASTQSKGNGTVQEGFFFYFFLVTIMLSFETLILCFVVVCFDSCSGFHRFSV